MTTGQKVAHRTSQGSVLLLPPIHHWHIPPYFLRRCIFSTVDTDWLHGAESFLKRY